MVARMLPEHALSPFRVFLSHCIVLSKSVQLVLLLIHRVITLIGSVLKENVVAFEGRRVMSSLQVFGVSAGPSHAKALRVYESLKTCIWIWYMEATMNSSTNVTKGPICNVINLRCLSKCLRFSEYSSLVSPDRSICSIMNKNAEFPHLLDFEFAVPGMLFNHIEHQQICVSILVKCTLCAFEP